MSGTKSFQSAFIIEIRERNLCGCDNFSRDGFISGESWFFINFEVLHMNSCISYFLLLSLNFSFFYYSYSRSEGFFPTVKPKVKS